MLDHHDHKLNLHSTLIKYKDIAEVKVDNSYNIYIPLWLNIKYIANVRSYCKSTVIYIPLWLNIKLKF